MIDRIKSRLVKITRAAGELAALLERPLPPLHESRLAAKLANIDGELTELLAHTKQLLPAAEDAAMDVCPPRSQRSNYR
jgi:hypothetical protein